MQPSLACSDLPCCVDLRGNNLVRRSLQGCQVCCEKRWRLPMHVCSVLTFCGRM